MKSCLVVVAVIWGTVAVAMEGETDVLVRPPSRPSYSLSLEAMAGYGGRAAYREGFGARVAMNFRGGWYVGATAMGHYGVKGTRASASYLALESGYTVKLGGPVSVRPSIQGGIQASGHPLVSPGMGLVARVMEPVFLSTEVRAHMATGNSSWASYFSFGMEL